MKTLIYFASGPIREEYQELDFDRIYLIDNCFKRGHRGNHCFSKGKISCIGMDCLDSIQYLKDKGVKIDCFVSLNEGLWEGGGSYAINSDMFLGYAMPLFKDEYIHIMNKDYDRQWDHKVSMDLPFAMTEILNNDSRYLDPLIFTEYKVQNKQAQVFQMRRLNTPNIELSLNQNINFQIIHDSIWNYYEKLDACIISFSNQGQRDFFNKIPRVLDYKNNTLSDIFDYCDRNQISKIGFTPFGGGDYSLLIHLIKGCKRDYPKEVYVFHLNKNDYRELKKYAVSRAPHLLVEHHT